MFSPQNHFWIYAFAVSAMLLDIISSNYYPQIIQESVKPSQFHKFFNSFSKAEIFGKLSAGVVALTLAQLRVLPVIALVLWILFVMHAYYFFRIYRLYYLPNLRVDKIELRKDWGVSLKAFKNSRLSHLALTLVVWASTARFLIDNSYYQAIDSTLTSKTGVASYIASFDLILNVSSFVLVQIITPFVIRRFSFSQALTFLPVTLIVVGLLALFFNPLFFATLLMLSYYTLFRCVHRPVFRQCTTAIPPITRRKVAIFLNILPAVASLIISGLLKFASAYFDITLLLMMVIFISVVLFLLINQLDSLYVRNLWSHTLVDQEDTGLSPYADTMLTMQTSADSELAEKEEESKKDSREHLTFPQRIERAYAKEYSSTQLLRFARLHADRLLRDGNYLRDELGAVVYKFKPMIREKVFHILDKGWNYDFYQTDLYKQKIAPIESFFEDSKISHLNLVIQSRLRRYLTQVLAKPSYPGFHQIPFMLKYDSYLIQDLVELFLDPELEAYHVYLFEAIQDHGTFRLTPVIENLSYLSYREGAPLRKMIAALAKHCDSEIENYVASSYQELERHKFHVLKSKTHGENRELFTRFLNTIYLNELILRPKSVSKMIRDSIEKLVDADHADYEMMLEIHRRFLLKGRFQNHIVEMM